VEKEPRIFAIKGNSLDDGPGIRTVIFFKGCPLSCVWCQNPESQSDGEELSYDIKECIDCGTCRTVCDRDAISRDNHFYIDRDICDLCYQCVQECPVGALTIVGQQMSIQAIVEVIKKDIRFFQNSGGGVTLSGGEPTLHMPFVAKLLQELKALNIHILLETCGQFSLAAFDQYIYPSIDQIYFDLKLIDPAEHRQYCGVSNNQILENFEILLKRDQEGGVPILPRIPLIPGITARPRNLGDIAQFLKDHGVTRVSLLEYNPLWLEKSAKIGQVSSFLGNTWMSREDVVQCKNYFEDFEIV
jgi:pyruvate formate lyase activating enzyme